MTKPIRAALLVSSQVPGAARLLGDGNRGVLFDLACVVSSEEIVDDAELFDAAHVPLFTARSDDGDIIDILRAHEVDFVFLAGWRSPVTARLLDAFADRVLALHSGDLTLLDADGRRRYRFDDAVRRAIFAGELETRSSLFFLNVHASVMLLSAPFAIPPMARDAIELGDYDLAVACANLHERWMIGASWGDLLARALEHLAAGNVQLHREVAWIDGVPGPCRIGDAPRLCHALASQIQRGIPSSCPFIES